MRKSMKPYNHNTKFNSLESEPQNPCFCVDVCVLLTKGALGSLLCVFRSHGMLLTSSTIWCLIFDTKNKDNVFS